MEENRNEKFEIEGRNAVMEAFRSGKTVDKLYLQAVMMAVSIQSCVKQRSRRRSLIMSRKRS